MTTSTNQFLKPLTTGVNSTGNLEIGGCDLVELAEKYGTPLYVLDEETIRAVCRDYKKAFAKYPKIHMMYASKALCVSAVTKILDNEGCKYYSIGLLNGVEIKPSPDWMQRRLTACGIRAINNVVFPVFFESYGYDIASCYQVVRKSEHGPRFDA